MAVPKRKVSKARRDSRSANKGIKPKTFGKCQNCSEPIMSHQACNACGFYKGHKVLTTKGERTIKRAEVRRTMEAAAAKHAPVTEADSSEPQE